MTISLPPMCWACAHLRKGEPAWTCAAFPDGIPEEITRSRFDHRQPHAGDGGTLFKQASNTPPPPWTVYGFAGRTG